MEDKQFKESIELIEAALKDRGYDPHIQLLGYITQKDPTYITSHNDARDLIQTLAFDKVKQYVQELER